VSALDNVSEYQFPYHKTDSGWGSVQAMQGQHEVGWMQTNPQGEISSLGVNEEHQHKGVATGMYNEALKHGPVTHSATRTRAGEGFAKSTGGAVPPLRGAGYLAPMEGPPVTYRSRPQ
jgi:hypothetical protein